MIRRGEDGFEPRFLLGRAFAELGQPDNALKEFQAAAKWQPDHPELKRAIAELNR